MSEQDPDCDRYSLFKQQIQSATSTYREFLENHRKNHTKQQSIDNFFTRGS